MDILGKLFGSAPKVKVIKLFLFNAESVFDMGEVTIRTKIGASLARREILNLERVGFIHGKIYTKEVKIQKNKKFIRTKRKVRGYILNYKFPHLELLFNFLSDSNALRPEDLIAKISKGIKIDLLLVAGVFLKNAESRVDLLIVGEHGKEEIIAEIVKDIESSLGREIMYVVFSTSEFKYRMSVFDRLLRDILDYPHEKLVNKLSI